MPLIRDVRGEFGTPSSDCHTVSSIPTLAQADLWPTNPPTVRIRAQGSLATPPPHPSFLLCTQHHLHSLRKNPTLTGVVKTNTHMIKENNHFM
jgi:hypothetical protein